MTDDELTCLKIAKLCKVMMPEVPLFTPNYLDDLNATHQMEDAIPPSRRAHYIDALDAIIDGPEKCVSDWDLVHATPRQRAEAFLRITADPNKPL